MQSSSQPRLTSPVRREPLEQKSIAALAGFSLPAIPSAPRAPQRGPRFEVLFPPERCAQPLHGQLPLVLSVWKKSAPRFDVGDGLGTKQIFGIEIDVAPGEYHVQPVLNRYDTSVRAHGHVAKLPSNRGEGQQSNAMRGISTVLRGRSRSDQPETNWSACRVRPREDAHAKDRRSWQVIAHTRS